MMNERIVFGEGISMNVPSLTICAIMAYLKSIGVVAPYLPDTRILEQKVGRIEEWWLLGQGGIDIEVFLFINGECHWGIVGFFVRSGEKGISIFDCVLEKMIMPNVLPEVLSSIFAQLPPAA